MASRTTLLGLCTSMAFWLLACQTSPSTETPQAEDGLTLEDTSTAALEPPVTPYDHVDEVVGLTERWIGDLDGMIARRRIRALVPYSLSTYYIDGAERYGISYEGMNYFEQALNEQLGHQAGAPNYVRVVFIPVTRDQLLNKLNEGYGDIAPANLMVTPKRAAQVDFSLPVISGDRELLVSGPSAPHIDSFPDLLGKTVYVRASSSFYEHLEYLNDSLRRIGLSTIVVEPLDEHLEDEEMLEMVHAGLLPMTFMGEFKSNLWENILTGLTIHREIAIHTDGDRAWAVRKDNPQLKAVLDEFVRKNRKGTLLGNLLFNRYMKNVDFVSNAFSSDDLQRFRDLRDYFIKYGDQYQLDWLLLAAQGYQESGLDQNKRSPAGAVGIMQIKPSTARDPNVNIPDIHRVESNIHAGTKYLRFLIDRYFVTTGVDSLNAGLLAVAAYNAGPARIRKLQEEAARQGFDPNVWFDNVELFAARDIGRETVQYVSNIYKYYISYRSMLLYYRKTGKDPLASD